MARNRKRAKERRARRPQPVAARRVESAEAPEPIAEAPDPLAHAAQPDDSPGAHLGEAGSLAGPTGEVELAEAQLALGRPELAEGAERDPEEEELEPGDIGGADESAGIGGPGGYDGEGPPSGGGGELVVPGGAVPEPRPRATNRLIGFLQGSWRELQRVQWPDRRQVAQATGVVIGFVIVAGVFLGVADFVAEKLMNYILK